MRKLLTFAVLFALTPGTAFAAGTSATVAGSSRAQAIIPLTLSHVGGRAIRFGRFTVGSSGTVVVPNSGAASVTGGVTFVTGSTTSLDQFIAFGLTGQQISITTSSGTVTSGANSMTFTTTPMLPAGFIPAGNAGSFTVGGTLSVPANQPVGTYNGTYLVTVAYN